MEVHQIIDDSTLKVVLDLIDNNLTPYVNQLDVCKVLLIVPNCLVNVLVCLDSTEKIFACNLRILSFVVWGRSLDLHDIRPDYILIVTFRLHIKRLDILGFALLGDPTATSLGGVGGIEYGNYTLFTVEPVYHIFECGLSGGMAHSFAFRVAFAEEIGGGLWGIISAVGTNIEAFGRYGEPSQIADHCGRDLVSLHVLSRGKGQKDLSEL